MKSKTLLILLASLAVLSLSGCGKRVIFVQPGTVCKTDKEIITDVWAPNEKGELELGKAKIPAGAAVVVPEKK